MQNKRGEITKIGDFLKDYITNSRFLKSGLDKVQVRDAWYEVMGNTGKYTTDIHLDRQTLYVKLSSAALRQELDYGKEKIRQMLNEELGRELILKLVLC